MKKQAVLGDPAQIEKAIKFIAALKEKVPDAESDESSRLRNSEGD